MSSGLQLGSSEDPHTSRASAPAIGSGQPPAPLAVMPAQELNELADGAVTSNQAVATIAQTADEPISGAGRSLPPPKSIPAGGPGTSTAKRIMDVTLASAALVALGPVMLAIALAVRLTSPGPAIFRHTRIGRDGVPFQMWKFRTMRADAEAVLHGDPVLLRRYLENNHKLPAAEDPRITRVGRVLRRTSVDELPQLVNVLRGEMSLVGPRPVERAQLDSFGVESRYTATRPGITGAWQVSGRSQIDLHERVAIESRYVEEWSLVSDVRLLLATPAVVLSCRGAY